jgi:hypothetical protein
MSRYTQAELLFLIDYFSVPVEDDDDKTWADMDQWERIEHGMDPWEEGKEY